MKPLLECTVPIVAAPMAGGPTTAELAKAVAQAGGFAFLAGGYKNAGTLSNEIEQVRRSGLPFGVNLFVPSTVAVNEAEFGAYATDLSDEAARYGVTLDPVPIADDDDWRAKLELLLRSPVPVVSLTFGLPAIGDIAALRRTGSRVLATVTTAAEARQANDAGVDGLIVQGPDAGGHSGTYDPGRVLVPTRTPDLVAEVRAATDLPVIAAGGVDGPVSVRRLLDAGAEAVAAGTMFLLADEAGTSPTHRAALTDDSFSETVVTHAFTGRPARALRNGFIDRHDDRAPLAYPAVHHLTRGLRQAASSAGDSDRLHLWAGTGWQHAPAAPAREIVGWLYEA